MKSNVCKIDKGTQDLEAIFRESEKVAVYNELTHKQALQLRLLCEEIDGMLPNVIDDFDGDLWFEFEEGVCKINISIRIPELNIGNKDELISIAKSRKNAVATGIGGKIRNAIENFILDEDAMKLMTAPAGEYRLATGYSMAINYNCYWSLDHYRKTVNKNETADAWDELEKSVIASVADDVIVGVKGKQAEIIIVKKFA